MSDRADLIRAQRDANVAAEEAARYLGEDASDAIVTALLAVRLEIRALAILLDTFKAKRA